MPSGDFQGFRDFHYDSVYLGTIVGIYPIDPATRRLYVDVLPLDNRGFVKKALVLTAPGFTMNYRKGMSCLVAAVNGNPQNAVVLLHGYTAEPNDSLFADPMPDGVQYIDDVLLHHDGAKAFLRLRSRTSSASQAAPDGSPAQVDLTLNSGLSLELYEYNPDTAAQPNQPPPPPTRARVTLTTPQGALLEIDEPEAGQVTFSLTLPGGAALSCDANGKWTVNSPQEIALIAPDVEIGAEGGKTLAFFSELAALTMWAATHAHTGVQGGPSTSGPPVAEPPSPVGTQNTHAV